eukprot:CAMPEP_0115838332 /NCGR_PEP_ID=MMETSP0287-20121206/5673_1 /TAXON_ID=412157 /ORGANISM="Chrysochromulina rotalis, Strain UIO044" /LENGTH=31 /DNA_ID= /DNA_START= /DNA_END= /DNA_ORIENTATION=
MLQQQRRTDEWSDVVRKDVPMTPMAEAAEVA